MSADTPAPERSDSLVQRLFSKSRTSCLPRAVFLLKKARKTLQPKKTNLTDPSREEAKNYVLEAKELILLSFDGVLEEFPKSLGDEAVEFTLLRKSIEQLLVDTVFFSQFRTYKDFGGRDKYLEFLYEYVSRLIDIFLGYHDLLCRVMEKGTGEFKEAVSEMIRPDPEKLPEDSSVSERIVMDKRWLDRFNRIPGILELEDAPKNLAETFCSVASRQELTRIPDIFAWIVEDSCFQICWSDADFFILLNDQTIEFTRLPGPLIVDFEDIDQSIAHLIKNEKFYFQTVLPTLGKTAT